jgi:hypothetical protein
MVRVTHPHHPLYNQNVKVLRRAGHPAYPGPRCLIELPDGTRAEIPTAWTAAPQTSPAEQFPEGWASASEYLSLAAIVHALSSSIAEEVEDEKRNRPSRERDPVAVEQPGSAGKPAEIGGPARNQAGGVDPGAGEPADARSSAAGPVGGAP